jgi:hypothetical protein
MQRFLEAKPSDNIAAKLDLSKAFNTLPKDHMLGCYARTAQLLPPGVFMIIAAVF